MTIVHCGEGLTKDLSVQIPHIPFRVDRYSQYRYKLIVNESLIFEKKSVSVGGGDTIAGRVSYYHQLSLTSRYVQFFYL